MVRKNKEGLASDIKYYTKVKQTLMLQGHSEAEAHLQALARAFNRAKGVGAFMVYRGITEKILYANGVDKIDYGKYFAFVNRCMRKIVEGQTIDLVEEMKRFKNKGLDTKIVNKLFTLFGEFM